MLHSITADNAVTPMTADKPQIVPLTPHSNCSTVGSGDANNSTLIQFVSSPNAVVCWSVMVSTSTKTRRLSHDTVCAGVIFKQGLTVTYEPSGDGAYFVLLSGQIVDAGKTYPFHDLVIYTSAGVETAVAPADKA